MRKPKPLSPQSVQMYKDSLDHYENLDKKARDDGVTYDEMKTLLAAKRMLDRILWTDRHIILAAHEAALKE